MTKGNIAQATQEEKPLGIRWQGHEGETILLDQDGNLTLDDVQSTLGHCVDALYVLREYGMSLDEGQFPRGILDTMFLICYGLEDFQKKFGELCADLEAMDENRVELRAENAKLKQSIEKQKK